MYRKFEYQNPTRFTPTEIPTCFSGVAEFDIEGNCQIKQVYLNNIEMPVGYLSDALLFMLEKAACECEKEARQESIFLPDGNLYDKYYPLKSISGEALISVHERVRSGDNAFQVNLYEVIKIERKNDDLNL